jgi:hypothetical protein
MSAGHIVAGQCVDVAASTDAYYGNALPTQSAGNPAFISTFTKSATGWMHETYQGGTLISSVAAPVPTFSTCDTTEGFFDGMTLGWGVAAVMVAVYVIRRPYR